MSEDTRQEPPAFAPDACREKERERSPTENEIAILLLKLLGRYLSRALIVNCSTDVKNLAQAYRAVRGNAHQNVALQLHGETQRQLQKILDALLDRWSPAEDERSI